MLPAHEVRILKNHIRKLLSHLKEKNMNTMTEREIDEQQLRMLELIDATLESFAQLDEMLTRMPPECLTPEDYRNWEMARAVAERSRALRAILSGEEKPGRVPFYAGPQIRGSIHD